MIELRWLEREVKPSPSDDIDAVTYIKMVLQYRCPVVVLTNGEDGPLLKGLDMWSDWRDVPTVREED